MLRSYRASGGHCAEIENSFGQSEQLIWGLHRQRRYFDLILFTTCWKYKWHRLPGSTATLHITTAIECCYLVCYDELMAVIIIGAYLVHDLRTWKFLNQHIFFFTSHRSQKACCTTNRNNRKYKDSTGYFLWMWAHLHFSEFFFVMETGGENERGIETWKVLKMLL